MKIELKGYVITQLKDGRYHAKNASLNQEFIVEELSEAIETIKNA